MLAAMPCFAQSASSDLGLFTSQSDIGTILHPGSAQYDTAADSYSIRGSGDNTWFRSDDLHYVWKKVSGDVELAADIRFIGDAGNAHRKAMLMIRQSLAPDAPYVDVSRHGDGLTSLQYRNAAGDVTREVRARVEGPLRVGIARHSDLFYVYFARAGGAVQFSGAAMKLPMHGAVYVGLGVCSHDKDVVEQAVFSHVNLSNAPLSAGPLVSTLETVPIASTDRSVVYSQASHFEAPNWLPDNTGFLINQDGHLQRVLPDGSAVEPIGTGTADQCNNDHGISPDGAKIAFSDSSDGGVSHIYTISAGGGIPQRITQNGPSYWHGWSPDGATLALTGERDGDFDVYTIPVAGGAEKRLTTAKGLDDGPEYSPDGQFIYFNSERTGHMQIWRMRANGSGQEQVTADATNDWFPHISPDGKWMVYLAYSPGVKGHPGGEDVTIELRSMVDGKTSLLAKLWGGQGTINVPSWSPDSGSVAFVSYAAAPGSF